jgi:hypothetical protein
VTGEDHPDVAVVLARLLQEEPNCIGSHCRLLMADPEGNEFCVVGD